MGKTLIQTCNRCGNEARAIGEEIQHMPWCGKTFMVDAQGMLHLNIELRTIRWEKVVTKMCIHGNDVTMSPHECEDCSIMIAESRCPQM